MAKSLGCTSTCLNAYIPSCLLFSLFCAICSERGITTLGGWTGGGGAGGGGIPPGPGGGGGAAGGALDD